MFNSIPAHTKIDQLLSVITKGSVFRVLEYWQMLLAIRQQIWKLLCNYLVARVWKSVAMGIGPLYSRRCVNYTVIL